MAFMESKLKPPTVDLPLVQCDSVARVAAMISDVEPIHIPPSSGSSPTSPFVFLHGFSDLGDAFTGLISHLQSLPLSPFENTHFILPTSPIDHESMDRGWYTPRPFSAIPVCRSSRGEAPPPKQDGELGEEEDDDDVEGIKKSCAAIRQLIAEFTSKTPIHPARILVAGFSQGAVLSLNIALNADISGSEIEHAQQVGAVAALMGCLPSSRKLEFKPAADTAFFMANGTRDMLIPSWVARDSQARLRKVVGADDRVTTGMYDGIGHRLNAQVINDLVDWIGALWK